MFYPSDDWTPDPDRTYWLGESCNVWFTGFSPNIWSSLYRTTQCFPLNTAAITDPKISICLLALRLKPVNIVPESGSNATTAHGANHIHRKESSRRRCQLPSWRITKPLSGSNRSYHFSIHSCHNSWLKSSTKKPEIRRGSSDRVANYGLSSRNFMSLLGTAQIFIVKFSETRWLWSGFSLPIFRLRRYECPACSCCSVARVWCSWET